MSADTILTVVVFVLAGCLGLLVAMAVHYGPIVDPIDDEEGRR